MLLPDDLNYLFINPFGCFRRAHQRGISSQILIIHRFHGNHVKFIRHAISRYHGSCDLGCLLDIIGGSCGNRMENNFLCRPSACKGGNLI